MTLVPAYVLAVAQSGRPFDVFALAEEQMLAVAQLNAVGNRQPGGVGRGTERGGDAIITFWLQP
ncbi:hypothetical protein AAGW05_14745 [Arthrobacter sp. LAPM80]|uniref:hypothetical protein n=1 Tax=Arthrobacter sp. LAPM80 TaxID=3141788 RepID=UPI00398A671E